MNKEDKKKQKAKTFFTIVSFILLYDIHYIDIPTNNIKQQMCLFVPLSDIKENNGIILMGIILCTTNIQFKKER